MQSRIPEPPLRHGVFSLIRTNSEIIKKQFHVRRIGLFGSVIRGEEREDSDVDILVDFECGHSTLHNYMSLQRFMQALFSRKIDLVTTGSLSPYIRPDIEREVVWVG